MASLPKYFIFLWLSGLLIPYLYFLMIRYSHFIFFYFKYDLVIQLSSIFLMIQLLSTLASLKLPFQSEIRYLAIFHNYFCFLFFVLGYIFQKYNNNFRLSFNRNLRVLYCFSVSLSILSFLYFFFTAKPLYYKGIIAFLTGVKNSYTLVKFVSVGYAFGNVVPRVQLFGLYSNTAAIVMYIIYTFYLIRLRQKSSFLKIIFVVISAISIATTGSRIVFLSFLIFSFFYFQKGKKSLCLFVVIFFLLVLFFWHSIKDLILFFASIRSSSNITRIEIYKLSLFLMENYNFLLGLGLKPKIPQMLEFPIGSHSSVLGYFVKSGILGGFFFLSVYAIFFILFFRSIFKRVYTEREEFLFSIFGLLLIYLFEDFDAYELTAFLTGVLLGAWRLSNVSNFKKKSSKWMAKT